MRKSTRWLTQSRLLLAGAGLLLLSHPAMAASVGKNTSALPSSPTSSSSVTLSALQKTLVSNHTDHDPLCINIYDASTPLPSITGVTVAPNNGNPSHDILLVGHPYTVVVFTDYMNPNSKERVELRMYYISLNSSGNPVLTPLPDRHNVCYTITPVPTPPSMPGITMFTVTFTDKVFYLGLDTGDNESHLKRKMMIGAVTIDTTDISQEPAGHVRYKELFLEPVSLLLKDDQ